jgi:hypothetical protein
MVIFMAIAFRGMCLTARSSACGAIPVTQSYILPRLGGKPWPRVMRFGSRCGISGVIFDALPPS